MKFIYKIVLVRMRYANEGMYVQQIKFFVGGVLFVVVVCCCCLLMFCMCVNVEWYHCLKNERRICYIYRLVLFLTKRNKRKSIRTHRPYYCKYGSLWWIYFWTILISKAHFDNEQQLRTLIVWIMGKFMLKKFLNVSSTTRNEQTLLTHKHSRWGLPKQSGSPPIPLKNHPQ